MSIPGYILYTMLKLSSLCEGAHILQEYCEKLGCIKNIFEASCKKMCRKMIKIILMIIIVIKIFLLLILLLYGNIVHAIYIMHYHRVSRLYK